MTALMPAEVIAADQERLRVFRDQNPSVVILLKAFRPTAFIGDRKYQAGTLHELLDQLDQVFPPSGP